MRDTGTNSNTYATARDTISNSTGNANRESDGERNGERNGDSHTGWADSEPNTKPGITGAQPLDPSRGSERC